MRRTTISRHCFLQSIRGVVCAVLLGVGGPSLAEAVSMELHDQGAGTYLLEGMMEVPVTPYQVWKVLTDYENISKFVTSLRKSTIADSTTERLLLEQEALGKKLILTKRIQVRLQVTEIPYKRIEFEDILHKDFYFYKGSWELQSVEGGVRVTYRLHCRRHFMVPNFIAKDALRKSAESLLEEVQAEILRRYHKGEPS